MTEYHDGVPVLLPADAARAADKIRIQIIGIRAGWSAWAAREADNAAETGRDGAAGERWQELMSVDKALRAAETQLETAIEKIGEAQPCPDPGPCVHGPDAHPWRPTCQQDRDSAW